MEWTDNGKIMPAWITLSEKEQSRAMREEREDEGEGEAPPKETRLNARWP